MNVTKDLRESMPGETLVKYRFILFWDKDIRLGKKLNVTVMLIIKI